MCGFSTHLNVPFDAAVAKVTDALEAEGFGLLLPCNVVVRQDADGPVTVVFMNPEVVPELADLPEVQALGKDVRTILQRVCTSL